jgi:hypothetical protein
MILGLRAISAARLLDRLLSLLHGIPEIVVDDAEPRHLRDDPFRRRVQSRDALARIRVLDEALSVPNDPADIHLVVEDAVPTFGASVDGAEAPWTATGCGNSLAVEFCRDPFG